jgi:hypothetical protein
VCIEQQDAGKRVWCWGLALPGFKPTLKNFEFFVLAVNGYFTSASRLVLCSTLYRWFVGVELPHKFVADWFHLEVRERLGMPKGNKRSKDATAAETVVN